MRMRFRGTWSPRRGELSAGASGRCRRERCHGPADEQEVGEEIVFAAEMAEMAKRRNWIRGAGVNSCKNLRVRRTPGTDGKYTGVGFTPVV